MPTYDDPGDALRRLLEERERAKKAVYAAHMAREKAEEEMAALKDKERARSQVIDSLTAENTRLQNNESAFIDLERAWKKQVSELRTQAEKAQKRVGILETILGRVENEIYNAIQEEDEFVPLEDIVEDVVEDAGRTDVAKELDEITAGDPHEGPHGPPDLDPDMPFASFGTNTLGRAIVGAARFIRPRWRVFSLALAAPFALMTLLLGLASAGVYVDEARFLWSPWPDDSIKWAVGLLGTAVFLLLPLTSLPRLSKSPVDSPVDVAPPIDGGTASNLVEYMAALRDIFGEDDDEEEKGTPEEP